MSSVSDTNKKRLFKAAAELFAEKGFDAVSTRDLCSKAEVNVAAISYYFGGKEGLYLEVFREYAQKMAGRVDQILSKYQNAEKSPEMLKEALRDFLIGFIQIRIQEPEVAIVLQRYVMNKIPEVRQTFKDVMEPTGDKLTQFFQDLQKAHLIREDLNIRSFLIVMIEAIWGYFTMQGRGGTSLMKDAYYLPEDQEKFVEFLIQIYLRGIS